MTHGSRTGRKLARGLGAGVAGVLVSGVLMTPPAQATTTIGSLPGGTAFSTDIQFPGSGGSVPEGPVVLVGSSTLGAVGTTMLVYTADTSGSTVLSDVAPGGCGGNRNPAQDALTDTLLDCEIAAIETMNDQAVSSGVTQVGLAVFAGDGAVADVSPAAGTQTTTGPATDADSDGDRDIDEVARSFYTDTSGGDSGAELFTPVVVPAGATNFAEGVSSTLAVAAASSATRKVAVFISDGLPTGGAISPSALSGSGVRFFTFAVGDTASCNGGNAATTGTLAQIAGLTGGTCTPVNDLTDLPSVIPQVVLSRVTAMAYTLDGGPSTPVPAAERSTTLPAVGPVEVRVGVQLGVLAPGPHAACLIGTGRDSGGSNQVSDCHNFYVSNAPQVLLPSVAGGPEGQAINLPDPAVTNLDVGETLSYDWSWARRIGLGAPDPAATCSFNAANLATPTITCTDNGTYDLTLAVWDGVNPPVQANLALTVQNRAPLLSLTSPASVHFRPGGSVDVASTFLDPGSNDTHSCTFTWADGATSPLVRPASGGTCTEAGPSYFQPGLHNLTVKVTDDDGGFDTVTVAVLVDAAPTSEAGQAVTGPEGTAIGLDGTVTDDSINPHSTLWSLPAPLALDAGGSCTFAAPAAVDTSVRCTDDGTVTARLTATDGLGNDQDSTQVTVTNVAPALVLTSPSAGVEYPTPSAITLTGSFTDPGANDSHECTIDWAGTAAPGTVGAGTCTGTRTLTTPGLHTIAMSVRDDDGGADTESLQVTLNAPPTVDAGSNASGTEGSAIALSGSASDPDDAVTPTWTYQVVTGDVGTSCTFANAHAVTTTITCTDDAMVTATLTVHDGVNNAVADTTQVAISNAAPAAALTAPAIGGLYKMGSPVALAGSVTDAGTNDTQTCSVTWDDGATTAGLAVTGGSCSAAHTFAAAGVYTMALTATDDDGASATTSGLVVVYDPSAGFVTGGGTLQSPPGAYRRDSTLSGRATFGFVSKYQKGATTPTGQTEFQFHAGGFTFNSSSYQWLVVAGTKAQYKGLGTVNDVAGYGFLLTAYDGGKTGVDRLRMKVWQVSTGQVVYDNNVAGAGDDLDAADPQALSGGSIVIQR